MKAPRKAGGAARKRVTSRSSKASPPKAPKTGGRPGRLSGDGPQAERRGSLRDSLLHEVDRTSGKSLRARWDEARCVRFANYMRDPRVGLEHRRKQVLDELHSAAKESPQGFTDRANAALLEARKEFPNEAGGVFHCFQLQAIASLDAHRDLATLGHSPTPERVSAYICRIGMWADGLPT